jgi:uncharacterized protein (DUF2062 family)
VTVFTPFFGLHFLVAALLAKIMRGSILASLLATFIGNPLTYVPIAIISLQTGHFLLGTSPRSEVDESIFAKFGGAAGDLWHNFVAIFTPERAEWHELEIFYRDVFFPWLVGGLIPGVVCGSGLLLPQRSGHPCLPETPLRAAAQEDGQAAPAGGRGGLTPRDNEGRTETAMTDKLRLGVNIDHVATLRNARGGALPDPVRAARMAEAAGADGITAHLREDRRHIRDADIAAIMEAITIPLNFEMAATEEMQRIALSHGPHAACIVPERREERTTEGGLEVAGDQNRLAVSSAPCPTPGCACRSSSRPTPTRSQPPRASAPRWWSCTRAPIATTTPRAMSRPGTPSLRA